MTVPLILFFCFIVVGIAASAFFMRKMNRADARKWAPKKAIVTRP